VTINNRSGIPLGAIDVRMSDAHVVLAQAGKNENVSATESIFIPVGKIVTQPYWLAAPMDKGSFNVEDQQTIGLAENQPPQVTFTVNIEGVPFSFDKPIRYKYTDPVRGELYQPVSIIPVADLKFDKDIYLLKERDTIQASLRVSPNLDKAGRLDVRALMDDTTGAREKSTTFALNGLVKDKPELFRIPLKFNTHANIYNTTLHGALLETGENIIASTYKRVISYDHIPAIVYQKEATAKPVYLDFKIVGKLVGYIPGAGDKVPQALNEMGYRVVVLGEKDIRAGNLAQYDAIVAGVRAYNINGWMNNVYDDLMEYVKQGGTLLTQYNTSNQIGPVKARMAPYPFAISRNRITDEDAEVRFLLPNHPALNYPNKISEKDFRGWIQERSIYNAEKIDSNYQRILSIRDPGEDEQEGSLIVANYGKGRFVYTGLVFFRELPAGVPGAYRLFANLIAVNRTEKAKKAVAPARSATSSSK
jgi:hypothetical protein